MQKGRSPMSDRILFSIGEALIDMIPSRVGCSFDEVPAFSPVSYTHLTLPTNSLV